MGFLASKLTCYSSFVPTLSHHVLIPRQKWLSSKDRAAMLSSERMDTIAYQDGD